MTTPTPEHDKRNTPGGVHPDVLASMLYVQSVLPTADITTPFPAWHGWALREAFLAGVSHRKAQEGAKK